MTNYYRNAIFNGNLLNAINPNLNQLGFDYIHEEPNLAGLNTENGQFTFNGSYAQVPGWPIFFSVHLTPSTRVSARVLRAISATTTSAIMLRIPGTPPTDPLSTLVFVGSHGSPNTRRTTSAVNSARQTLAATLYRASTPMLLPALSSMATRV